MTYFKQFLGLKEVWFSVIFMHVMLFCLINNRVTKRKLWFIINGVKVCLSLVKFAFTTSLLFRDDTNVSHYMDILERLRLKKEYFPGVLRSL